MTAQSVPAFGRVRSLFWPIQRNELRLFLPLLLIFFFICLNYNVLRVSKDTLVVMAAGSGAEAIPFIKVWAVLPSAFLITFLFTRLSNRCNFEKVFYIMMGVFLGFFALFGCVLYPLSLYLHPTDWADALANVLPVGFRGLIAIVRNWTFTLFYVFSELWSTMIMTVLFWGFANEIMSVGRAKRFYLLLMIGGNSASIFAGGSVGAICGVGHWLGSCTAQDEWRCSLMLLCCFIVIVGIATLATFSWFNRHALNGVNAVDGVSVKYKKPSEIKMGMRKNFIYLAKSKYLLCIAVIVLTYNICMNLTEVTWKDQLSALCANQNDYIAYMSKTLIWSGIVANVLAMCTVGFVQRGTWAVTAMITPAIMLVTAMVFFAIILMKDTLDVSLLQDYLGCSPLFLSVVVGALQNCLARGSKYSIFDATKEIAFIPLSQECRLKGKAAIDGIGSRLGKSGGAVVLQLLLVTLGTVAACTPYVAAILLVVIGAWMWAVRSLGAQFQTITTGREEMVHDVARNAAVTEAEPALAPIGSAHMR